MFNLHVSKRTFGSFPGWMTCFCIRVLTTSDSRWDRRYHNGNNNNNKNNTHDVSNPWMTNQHSTMIPLSFTHLMDCSPTVPFPRSIHPTADSANDPIAPPSLLLRRRHHPSSSTFPPPFSVSKPTPVSYSNYRP